MYSRDLAHVHDVAFGDFSRRVAPEIVRVLRNAGITGGRVVEAGCGSGILAKHLSDAGYRVHGFDVSASMIRLARTRAPRAAFRVASLTRAKIPPCDAVIAVGEVVTYVRGGLPALRTFFRRVHRALGPGGVFIFDFIHSARGRTYRTKTLGNRTWTMAVRAGYDPRTRTLTRDIVVVRRRVREHHSRERHTVRVYTKREIVSALERIGFRAATSRSFGRHRLLRGDTAVVARRL